MIQASVLLSSILGNALAGAHTFQQKYARDFDPAITAAIVAANIPKYVPPPLNGDITEWFAIGDSYSAGISADTPNDSINPACGRFNMSYPALMNEDPRFPGHSISKNFVFASCAGASMQDVVDKQISLLLPDMKANFPKLEKPQIGTVSLAWNDLGFDEIMNSCIFQWVGYSKECLAALTATHATLNGTSNEFKMKVVLSLIEALKRGRDANPGFQLYVTGYVRLWNETNNQCDTVSWAPSYKTPVYISTNLRQEMNSLVKELNAVIEQAVESLEAAVGGAYFVNEFQARFDGHRFCEVESDPNYLKLPIDQRTWLIHHGSPYGDMSFSGGSGPSTFFDMVDSILIPPKDGKSTMDQIKAANGSLSSINPAYGNISSMTAALNKLAQQDAKYANLPTIWARIMYPKSSGYKEMASAVIDQVLKYNTGPTDPGFPQGLHCIGTDINKFLNRDDLSSQIPLFCAEAAGQKDHDTGSGSIVRNYHPGTRYEVQFGIDWPQGLDISQNMEASCIGNMTMIMDSCGGNDPSNLANWKRGGRLGAGWVNYNVVPMADQGYVPGTCSFHLQEDESWTEDANTMSRSDFVYHIEQATMKDAAGKTIGTVGFAPNGVDPAMIEAGDGHPLILDSKLPDRLEITPEVRGKPADYVQFTIGSQSWTTSTTTGNVARCDTGSWSANYSPRHRTMDCYFIC
ncbi:SGNH hydrolase-type esterase domain-containing protein [Nemania sp. FL0916]|nr:SGNH hydrolase-type esterase domain-containing protein [Nemania sp. FL0916]